VTILRRYTAFYKAQHHLLVFLTMQLSSDQQRLARSPCTERRVKQSDAYPPLAFHLVRSSN
jgi:hypothetical protein